MLTTINSITLKIIIKALMNNNDYRVKSYFKVNEKILITILTIHIKINKIDKNSYNIKK